MALSNIENQMETLGYMVAKRDRVHGPDPEWNGTNFKPKKERNKETKNGTNAYTVFVSVAVWAQSASGL